MKQFVLDTETTGLYPNQGDRIVEVAIIELNNLVPTGRIFHSLVNPERDIPQVVVDIHGIDNEKVKDAPTFPEICDDIMQFVGNDGILVAHNAEFDMNFLNHEMKAARGYDMLEGNDLTVLCTRNISRKIWPRQPARLDNVCDRLGVDRSKRELHGALLDAQLLVECYVKMCEK